MQAEIANATTTEGKPDFMMATRSCAPLRPQRCGLNDELSKWSPLRKSNKTEHFELLMRSSKCRGRKFRSLPKTGAATTHLEHRRDLFSENAFADLAFSPTRIVQLFAAASRANSFQHFRLSLRKMFVQPMFEQRPHCPRQSQQHVTGKLRAGFCAGGNNRRNFVIVNPRNHRRNHHADRNVCRAQLSDGVQPRRRS